MAEQEEQATQAEQEEEQDPRPGYTRIETGSTKHPEAAESEDGRVVARIGVYTGDTLEEAIERYGEEFVFSNYKRSVIVASQGKVRRELDAGTPISTVEDNLDDLDPTEQRSTIQDPQVQAMRAFNNMSDEQKEQFMKIAVLG